MRFGMGLSSMHVSRPDRRDRLLLISALAIAVLSLLGAAGERIGYDRWLKANTVKRRDAFVVSAGADAVPPPPQLARGCLRRDLMPATIRGCMRFESGFRAVSGDRRRAKASRSECGFINDRISMVTLCGDIGAGSAS